MTHDVEADVRSTDSFPPESEPAQSHPEELEPMLFCPVCSLRLDQRKCKLFCNQCGYYMSCADYY